MRRFMPGVVVFGAFVLVNVIGVVAFLAVGKVALYFDPSANESHFLDFMVAITGVAVAVGSAFPIFSRGVPWFAAHLARVWPERPPEQPLL